MRQRECDGLGTADRLAPQFGSGINHPANQIRCMGAESFAGWCQRHWIPRATIEQFDPEPEFERLDAPTEGRWRAVPLVGRYPEAAGFRKCHEV
jgi:hypothetical protein